MKTKTITYSLLALAAIYNTAYAQMSEKAASTIMKQFNTPTRAHIETLITPTDGEEAVIVVCMKSLHPEGLRKLWTFLVAISIGEYYNENSDVSVKEIWLSDNTDMNTRPARYAILEVSLAKEIQTQLYAGEIKLQDGMDKIWMSLQHKTKEIK